MVHAQRFRAVTFGLPGHMKANQKNKKTVSTNHKSACRLLVIPTIIDALLEGCTEGVWLLANAVEGAGSVDTSPVPTVGGIFTLIHI